VDRQGGIDKDDDCHDGDSAGKKRQKTKYIRRHRYGFLRVSPHFVSTYPVCVCVCVCLCLCLCVSVCVCVCVCVCVRVWSLIAI
jgi:hypothetical protein